uniref:Uncharacterized protein n=1 Tax=Alexandrium monilatum TaxID=311494 RepID=A0A7S4SI08_9DINO
MATPHLAGASTCPSRSTAHVPREHSQPALAGEAAAEPPGPGVAAPAAAEAAPPGNPPGPDAAEEASAKPPEPGAEGPTSAEAPSPSASVERGAEGPTAAVGAEAPVPLLEGAVAEKAPATAKRREAGGPAAEEAEVSTEERRHGAAIRGKAIFGTIGPRSVLDLWQLQELAPPHWLAREHPDGCYYLEDAISGECSFNWWDVLLKGQEAAERGAPTARAHGEKEPREAAPGAGVQPEGSLFELLRMARPQWREAAVRSVVSRLRHVGVRTVPSLASALGDGLDVTFRNHSFKPLSRSTKAALVELLNLTPKPKAPPRQLSASSLPGKEGEQFADCCVLSMGHYCLTADFLKQVGIRKQAMPTDYSAVTLKTWHHMLSDDFRTLLTPKDAGLREHPYNSVRGDVAMFIHQGKWASERIHARVERLRGVLRARRAFGLAIYLEGLRNLLATKEEVFQDAERVGELCDGFCHIVVVWCRSAYSSAAQRRHVWLHRGPRVSVLEFCPEKAYSLDDLMRPGDADMLLDLLAARFPGPFAAAAADRAAAFSEASSGGDTEEHWLDDFDETPYDAETRRRLREAAEEARLGLGLPPDEGWVLVFRQKRCAWRTPAFDDTAAADSASCFCRLLGLESFRDPATKRFLFKLTYPGRRHPNHNIWYQTTNPVQMKVGSRVAGFKAVELSYKMDDDWNEDHLAFQGLQKSAHSGYLLHGYDPRHPERFWYALGCRIFKPQYPGMRAGWPGANGSWEDDWVELFVKHMQVHDA